MESVCICVYRCMTLSTCLYMCACGTHTCIYRLVVNVYIWTYVCVHMCECIYTFRCVCVCILGIHVLFKLYDVNDHICVYPLVFMYGYICCMYLCVYVLGMCVYVECTHKDMCMCICWVCTCMCSHVYVKELLCWLSRRHSIWPRECHLHYHLQECTTLWGGSVCDL